jgi:hypothetical protein
LKRAKKKSNLERICYRVIWAILPFWDFCCYNVHMSHCYYRMCIVGFINIFVDALCIYGKSIRLHLFSVLGVLSSKMLLLFFFFNLVLYVPMWNGKSCGAFWWGYSAITFFKRIYFVYMQNIAISLVLDLHFWTKMDICCVTSLESLILILFTAHWIYNSLEYFALCWNINL